MFYALSDSGSRKAHGERGKETGRYFRDKYKHGSPKYSEKQQEDENREVGRETGRYYKERYGMFFLQLVYRIRVLCRCISNNQ